MSETPASPAPAPYDPPSWHGIDDKSQPQVWETPAFTPGELGINPSKQLDLLQPEEAAFRVNLMRRRQGGLTRRPGQTSLAAGGGAAITQIEELNNPQLAAYERYFACGSNLGRGLGGITIIDGGYSGNPLTLLPFRPRLSGQPWMLVGDSTKNRQVPYGGSPIPIGLPAPATAAAPAVADILTTAIAAFDSSDGTQAANWTANAGTTLPDDDGNTTPSDPPTLADVVGLSGNAVEMTLVPGAAGSGFYSFMSIAKVINLTELQGGLGPTPSNDDIMHIWLRCDRPDLLEEVRLYLVCSDAFVPTRVPGTDETGLENPDAFVKAYRPHDFTNFVELVQSGLAAGAVSRDNAIVGGFLNDPPQSAGGEVAESSDPYSPTGSDDLPTQVVPQLTPGRAAWSEFGTIGRPVRRGEFLRIGATPERGWNTITGIVVVVQTTANETVKVACDDAFLTGGYALDSSPATATSYDYRYTNYHTVTGDEGNPSPEQAANTFVEALRQRLKQTPPPYGDAAVRQRFYRRGGSLPDNWYFVGENSADGAEFVDEVSDEEASAADVVETDNYQPVPTFDSSGTTVLNQPVPFFFGPIDGVVFAAGDPYRPGVLYWSKSGRPGSWPTTNTYEVCAPSEQLMNGTALDSGGILWSQQRAFRVLSNVTQAGAPSVVEIPGAPGLNQRWAWCKADGVVYWVTRDSIVRSAGGAPEPITDKLRPIFEPESPQSNSLYPPINWTSPIRLEVHEQILWLLYTDSAAKVWKLAIDLRTGEIGEHQFGQGISCFHSDTGSDSRAGSLIHGGTSGTAWTWTGATDGGTAISWSVATGYLDGGRPREDKHLGDAFVRAALTGDLGFQVRLNNGTVVNTAMSVTGNGTEQYFTFDPFGIVPQFARNLQVTLSGTAQDIVLYKLGLSYASLPDQTMKRATQWQPLGVSEQYVKGCTIVCDTGDQTIEVLAEGTRTGLGDPFTMETLQVRANGKRLLQFSWATARAEQVRLRPITDCGPWRLFRVDWDHTAEPPRVGFWDSHPEQLGDQYFTGVDLDCNTLGQNKVVQVTVDGTAVTDQVSGTTNFTVNADGRRWIHLTFNAQVPIRGHVARLYSTDGVLGLLHGWKWHAQAEPNEQANWDQNFTIAVAMNDKAVKGVVLECDTFGEDKTVRIEIDGVLQTTKTVNADGRSVVNLTWEQGIGRVLRLYPTDANPGRLYSHQWIYDEEPFQLDRWETQEIDFGIGGRKSAFFLESAYKSDFPVTLTMLVYNTAGLLLQTLSYVLPAGSGTKQIQPVYFHSNAGWLYKFVWTVDDARGFWLYREETRLTVLGWNGKPLPDLNPFGDDDLDKVRSLSRATDISTASSGVQG